MSEYYNFPDEVLQPTSTFEQFLTNIHASNENEKHGAMVQR